jgi:hypothetical protein
MCWRRSFAVVASLAVTIGVAHAECDETHFRTGLDYPNASAQMRVSQDSACGTQLRARRQPGVTKTFHDIAVLQRPLHGIAGKAPGYLFAYQPAPGYVGHDSFALGIKFDENGVNGETRLDVDVDVYSTQ